MLRKPFIKKYSIFGLFGYKNLELTFDESIKILIGENGYGKTTILNSLAFLLKGDYNNLARIKFERIKIEFDDAHTYDFSINDLKAYNVYIEKKKDNEDGFLDYISNSFESSMLSQLMKLVNKDKEKFLEKIKENERFNGLPDSFIYKAFVELTEKHSITKKFNDLSTYINSTGYKILFYPTYRRIEVDLNNIINSALQGHRFRREQEELLNNNSIIKFGMKDVEKRRDKICNEITESSLSGFASVSGNMINKLLEPNYDNKDKHSFNINEIKIVLSRVGNNMSQEDKEKILSQISIDPSLSNQNPYLIYFLDQLLSVYKKQEKYDIAIKRFVKTCNKYLTKKEFIYDESTVSLRLQRTTDPINSEKIELTQLSSGEKQIVSIFSQLYLESDKKYIILFDEPELSLSIFWQEKLLPDMIDSGQCVFMLAVTHSPFIFNNDLKNNTVGLKEFIKDGNNK